jgi:hypothetical protein
MPLATTQDAGSNVIICFPFASAMLFLIDQNSLAACFFSSFVETIERQQSSLFDLADFQNFVGAGKFELQKYCGESELAD